MAEVTQQAGDREHEGEGGADLDHEHHRVFPLDVRAQHHEGLLERRPQQLGGEQPRTSAVAIPSRCACRSRPSTFDPESRR